MITTNKDFENLHTKDHPHTYYWDKNDTRPSANVINGARRIEMDSTNNTITILFFDKTANKWVGGE